MRVVRYVPVQTDEVELDAAIRDTLVQEQTLRKDYSRRAKRARDRGFDTGASTSASAVMFQGDVARALQSWPWDSPGHSVCVLHGPTGVGKSTACSRALQCYSGTVVRFADFSDETAVTVSLVQLESAVAPSSKPVVVVLDPVDARTTVPAQVLRAMNAQRSRTRTVVVWDNEDEAEARKWVLKTWPKTRIDRTLAVPPVPERALVGWLLAQKPVPPETAQLAAQLSRGSPRQALIICEWTLRGSRGSEGPRCDVIHRDPLAFLRDKHGPEEFARVDFDPSEFLGACHKLQCTSPEALSHLSVLHTRASPAIVSELLWRESRRRRH